jgi:hypothetical protein
MTLEMAFDKPMSSTNDYAPDIIERLRSIRRKEVVNIWCLRQEIGLKYQLTLPITAHNFVCQSLGGIVVKIVPLPKYSR